MADAPPLPPPLAEDSRTNLIPSGLAAAPPAKGCIMANHGMVVCDTSLAAAFELAANCEWTAGIQWRAMCAGTPVPLTEEQMGDALSAFATYGQPKEDEG